MAYAYKKVKLKNGKTMDEHRYIMMLHLGRPLLRNEFVHHKDGNKRNNDIGNLELMTAKDHQEHHGQDKHKLNAPPPPVMVGEEASSAKLTEELVIELRQLFKDSHKGLRKKAKELGINHSTLWLAITGRTWKHI